MGFFSGFFFFFFFFLGGGGGNLACFDLRLKVSVRVYLFVFFTLGS